ncbi:hypothetical protein NQZ68_015702 [Dissostichus eleginoides]|nr:hypothetical protein NQZ68_015702 [Dissostichus eleginoides]
MRAHCPYIHALACVEQLITVWIHAGQVVLLRQHSVHHSPPSPLQSPRGSVGFLQCSVRDAHLDLRGSRGHLRVEVLRSTSPCSHRGNTRTG